MARTARAPTTSTSHPKGDAAAVVRERASAMVGRSMVWVGRGGGLCGVVVWVWVWVGRGVEVVFKEDKPHGC